jgi:hypothetical protein
MPDNDAMLEWAERMALENLRGHLGNLDAIKKETVITLSVLFAALAGCVAFLGQHVDGKHLQPLAWGALGGAVWLFGVCAALVVRCLRIADAPAITNLGTALYQPQFTLEQMRKAELANIDKRSEQARRRAVSDSDWINRLRVFALLAPLAFMAGFALAPTPLRSCASAEAAAPPAPVVAPLHPVQGSTPRQ